MKSNRGYVVWAFSKIGVMLSVLVLILLLYMIYKYVSCINASDAGNLVAGNFANALIDVYAAPLGYEVAYELPGDAQGYAYELTVVNSPKKGVLASMNETRCEGTCGGAVLNIPLLDYPVPVKNLSENETIVIIRNEGSGVSILRPGECCKCVTVFEMHYDAGGPSVDDSDMLNDEYVVFRNDCSHPCSIEDWSVKDRVVTRKPYVFNSIALDQAEMITLRTGDGIDTPSEVFWNSTTLPNPAVWNNDGDTLYLRDSSGYLCHEYSYAP